jgi:molybdenum cofactor biosynthesis protein B
MRDERAPIGIAILTISDSRDENTDTSGGYLATAVIDAGHRLHAKAIVQDSIEPIRRAIRSWSASPAVDVIICTGGTGLTGRDVTPEAVQPLFDKAIDGFAAVWHALSYESIGPSTLQSRACAGIVNATFVFCLPGSNSAVRDGWTRIIAPQLDPRTRPCNLIEIMPRLAKR